MPRRNVRDSVHTDDSVNGAQCNKIRTPTACPACPAACVHLQCHERSFGRHFCDFFSAFYDLGRYAFRVTCDVFGVACCTCGASATATVVKQSERTASASARVRRGAWKKWSGRLWKRHAGALRISVGLRRRQIAELLCNRDALLEQPWRLRRRAVLRAIVLRAIGLRAVGLHERRLLCEFNLRHHGSRVPRRRHRRADLLNLWRRERRRGIGATAAISAVGMRASIADAILLELLIQEEKQVEQDGSDDQEDNEVAKATAALAAARAAGT